MGGWGVSISQEGGRERWVSGWVGGNDSFGSVENTKCPFHVSFFWTDIDSIFERLSGFDQTDIDRGFSGARSFRSLQFLRF